MPAPAPVPVPGTIASAPRLRRGWPRERPRAPRTRSTAARRIASASRSKRLHSRECGRLLAVVAAAHRAAVPAAKGTAQRARSRGGPRGGGRFSRRAAVVQSFALAFFLSFEPRVAFRRVQAQPRENVADHARLYPSVERTVYPERRRVVHLQERRPERVVEDDVEAQNLEATRIASVSVARRAPGRNRVPGV